MITSIAGKGISIDGNALLLIANETAAQLTQIAAGKAADQIVADTVGGKTKDDLTNAINDAVASKPTLETFGQALGKGDLEFYNLRYWLENDFRFYNIRQNKFTKNDYKYGDINVSDAITKDSLLPTNFTTFVGSIDANGALVIKVDSIVSLTLHTIKTIPLKGRSVYSNSKFGNKEISGFSDGAKMYEVSRADGVNETAERAMDDSFISCIQTKEANTNILDECAENTTVFIGYDYSVTYNGDTIRHEGSSGIYSLGSVTLDKNSGTFTFYPSSQYVERFMDAPFVSFQPFTMSGKYTETGSGDSFVIKGVSLNGDVMFYIASAKSNSGKPILMIIRNATSVISRYFNEEAMKTVRDNWDESITPSW